MSPRLDLAVYISRKSIEHAVALMHNENLATSVGNRADEVAHEAVVIARVEPDAMLDGDWERDGIAHGCHARRDQPGLGHQACAEAAGLHTLGRAAAVQVDLVIAPALAEARCVGERARIAAA